jgi:hypothetical protein
VPSAQREYDARVDELNVLFVDRVRRMECRVQDREDALAAAIARVRERERTLEEAYQAKVNAALLGERQLIKEEERRIMEKLDRREAELQTEFNELLASMRAEQEEGLVKQHRSFMESLRGMWQDTLAYHAQCEDMWVSFREDQLFIMQAMFKEQQAHGNTQVRAQRAEAKKLFSEAVEGIHSGFVAEAQEAQRRHVTERERYVEQMNIRTAALRARYRATLDEALGMHVHTEARVLTGAMERVLALELRNTRQCIEHGFEIHAIHTEVAEAMVGNLRDSAVAQERAMAREEDAQRMRSQTRATADHFRWVREHGLIWDESSSRLFLEKEYLTAMQAVTVLMAKEVDSIEKRLPEFHPEYVYTAKEVDEMKKCYEARLRDHGTHLQQVMAAYTKALGEEVDSWVAAHTAMQDSLEARVDTARDAIIACATAHHTARDAIVDHWAAQVLDAVRAVCTDIDGRDHQRLLLVAKPTLHDAAALEHRVAAYYDQVASLHQAAVARMEHALAAAAVGADARRAVAVEGMHKEYLEASAALLRRLEQQQAVLQVLQMVHAQRHEGPPRPSIAFPRASPSAAAGHRSERYTRLSDIVENAVALSERVLAYELVDSSRVV